MYPLWQMRQGLSFDDSAASKGCRGSGREWQNCIVCGHCVAVCPTGAVEHSGFPAGKVHEFDYSDYPVPAQMMLLCKARRSNRAFTAQSVPEELLQQILEAAHRAPTASNAQQIGFTVVPIRSGYGKSPDLL